MTGRSPSGRNAVKHGLSAKIWRQSDAARIALLADMLKEGKSSKRIEQAAQRAAEARAFLERVAAMRDELVVAALGASEVVIAGEATSDRPDELELCCIQLDRLRRYERQA